MRSWIVLIGRRVLGKSEPILCATFLAVLFLLLILLIWTAPPRKPQPARPAVVRRSGLPAVAGCRAATHGLPLVPRGNAARAALLAPRLARQTASREPPACSGAPKIGDFRAAVRSAPRSRRRRRHRSLRCLRRSLRLASASLSRRLRRRDRIAPTAPFSPTHRTAPHRPAPQPQPRTSPASAAARPRNRTAQQAAAPPPPSRAFLAHADHTAQHRDSTAPPLHCPSTAGGVQGSGRRSRTGAKASAVRPVTPRSRSWASVPPVSRRSASSATRSTASTSTRRP